MEASKSLKEKLALTLTNCNERSRHKLRYFRDNGTHACKSHPCRASVAWQPKSFVRWSQQILTHSCYIIACHQDHVKNINKLKNEVKSFTRKRPAAAKKMKVRVHHILKHRQEFGDLRLIQALQLCDSFFFVCLFMLE